MCNGHKFSLHHSVDELCLIDTLQIDEDVDDIIDNEKNGTFVGFYPSIKLVECDVMYRVISRLIKNPDYMEIIIDSHANLSDKSLRTFNDI